MRVVIQRLQDVTDSDRFSVLWQNIDLPRIAARSCVASDGWNDGQNHLRAWGVGGGSKTLLLGKWKGYPVDGEDCIRALESEVPRKCCVCITTL